MYCTSLILLKYLCEWPLSPLLHSFLSNCIFTLGYITHQGVLTWDLLMTWLASSWIENLRPSSEEKDIMGERVPEVSTILCTTVLKSENACQHTHMLLSWAAYTQATNDIDTDYCSCNDKWMKIKTKQKISVMLLLRVRHLPQQD